MAELHIGTITYMFTDVERPGGKRENHLFWAAPGSGKTYFVQQTVASLPSSINYQEIKEMSSQIKLAMAFLVEEATRVGRL